MIWLLIFNTFICIGICTLSRWNSERQNEIEDFRAEINSMREDMENIYERIDQIEDVKEVKE